MLKRTNLLGALVAVGVYASATLVFILRLLDRPQYGRWIGFIELLLALSLGYLLLTARQLKRPVLYYAQIGLMLVWLLVELLLDYVLKVDFRSVGWMVISYVVLFFAGAGGMLGVAAHAGRGWTILAVILFLVMAALAFIQRAVTGMQVGEDWHDAQHCVQPARPRRRVPELQSRGHHPSGQQHVSSQPGRGRRPRRSVVRYRAAGDCLIIFAAYASM